MNKGCLLISLSESIESNICIHVNLHAYLILYPLVFSHTIIEYDSETWAKKETILHICEAKITCSSTLKKIYH